MRASSRVLTIVAALLVATTAAASLKDLNSDKLPSTPAVQKAYKDVLSLEPMADSWNESWPYKTSKADVAAALKEDLTALETAAQSAPDNEELSLLVGLTARYAYNVDVESSYQTAVDAFERAHKLAPADYRPEWFLGIHKCQANEIKQGMGVLLRVEEEFPWKNLPVDFWDDYIFCTAVSDMPAHGLRAEDHLEQLGAAPSGSLKIILDSVRDRLKTPDFSSKIKANDVWQSDDLDGAFLNTNFAFGLSLLSPSNWGVRFSDIENGVCAAQMQTEPMQGKTGSIYPNVLIIVRQPKPMETLQDFANRFLQSMSASPVSSGDCPVGNCLAFQARKPGAYGPDGDGYAFLRIFERDSPPYPGLLLENPSALPSGPAVNETAYYRPSSRFRRVSGRLYYLVMLDTAQSVLPQAQKEFVNFLQNLKVE